jgi:hypothetical protein
MAVLRLRYGRFLGASPRLAWPSHTGRGGRKIEDSPIGYIPASPSRPLAILVSSSQFEPVTANNSQY